MQLPLCLAVFLATLASAEYLKCTHAPSTPQA